MGLLVFIGHYLGRNRDESIVRLIAQIVADPADVIGLCEVYSDEERAYIRNAVKATHPYGAEGPKNGALSDGGLLLLSRHPFLPPYAQQIIFPDCEGNDCDADKGALHITIQIPNVPTPCDFIFSHAQSIAEEGGLAALCKQLSLMGTFLTAVSPPDRPAFIMGDLNMPGEDPKLLGEMIERLGAYIDLKPVDLWLAAGNAPDKGLTFVADNDFYEDPSDNPGLNHRLDYVLMKPGKRLIPIVQKMDVLMIKNNGHDISDHFGLRAAIENHVRVDF